MSEYKIQHLFKDRDFERLTREVNILLISDLHYNIEKEPFEDKNQFAHKINAALINSLREVQADWRPDLVIVAGDLVNKCDAKSYKYYFDLIRLLIEECPVLKNAVFATPGNHDIDRDGIETLIPLLCCVTDEEAKKVPSAIAATDTLKKIFLLSQNNHSDAENEVILPLLQGFEKAYFKTFLSKKEELNELKITGAIGLTYPVKGLHTVYTKDILGLRIASVNSSLFCNANQHLKELKAKKEGRNLKAEGDKKENDRNQLFYTGYVSDKLTAQLAESPYPIVTFMHHPYFYMHESEYIYPKLHNNNNFNKLAEYSDLILCGHVHGELHRPSVVYQNAYTIINGTTYTQDTIEDKAFPFTYALIKINKQLDKFRFWNFKFEEDAFKEKEKPGDYYPFQSRSYQRNVSTELEKVYVINYLKEDCPQSAAENPDDIDYDAEVIAPQLKAYTGLEVDKLSTERIKGFNSYLFRSVAGDKRILKIENENPFEKLAALLKDLKKRTQRPVIFLSIDVTKSITHQSTPGSFAEKVDAFSEELKKVILSSKYDTLNLNFIYY